MKKIVALLLAVSLLFAFTGCNSGSGKLTVGTGGETGTYYGYTGVLATYLGDKTDVNLSVVSTGGSKDNLVSMGRAFGRALAGWMHERSV